jgi:hypothetical protein
MKPAPVLYNKRDNIDAPPRTVQSFMREIFENKDGDSDKSEEEESIENNQMDKLIPNHKKISREEIIKFINKNEERECNNRIKSLGIQNEVPPRYPITLQDVMRDLFENCDSEIDEPDNK